MIKEKTKDNPSKPPRFIPNCFILFVTNQLFHLLNKLMGWLIVKDLLHPVGHSHRKEWQDKIAIL